MRVFSLGLCVCVSASVCVSLPLCALPSPAGDIQELSLLHPISVGAATGPERWPHEEGQSILLTFSRDTCRGSAIYIYTYSYICVRVCLALRGFTVWSLGFRTRLRGFGPLFMTGCSCCDWCSREQKGAFWAHFNGTLALWGVLTAA